jgi:EmrB/QacA subfamily drug resistance transporter
MKRAASSGWTFAIVSVALFMVVLDNLVVTNALPSIRHDLGATIQQLEWTVNAYTLTYAVLLLTGAALGDRFGRKRMFSIGLGVFTLASAAAAVAPGTGFLIAARALQGLGAAIVTPLTLTLLSEAVPVNKRGLAIGAWSGISGLAVALGPVVGGAVVTGISWHWIFWLNVPIGAVTIPLAMARLSESRGETRGFDVRGLTLVSGGLGGLVYGVVHAQSAGWITPTVLVPLAVGALLVAAFVAWELRAPEPMLPMGFFRNRAFTATNGVSLAMYFGTFGSVFLLAQFFQVTQHYSALQSGLRILPWTAMPIFIAPIAGILSDRIGGRPLMALGLALQGGAMTWLGAVSSPTVAYTRLVPAFVMAGAGMALVFAPAANTVLGAVRPKQAGQASGATNAIRELGGVLGVSVLGTVFTAHGGYASPQTFVDGLVPALHVGAGVLFAGALVALLVPGKRREAARAVAPAGVHALTAE